MKTDTYNTQWLLWCNSHEFHTRKSITSLIINSKNNYRQIYTKKVLSL